MADRPGGPRAPGSPSAVRVERFGDSALLVVVGETVDEAVNRRTLDLAAALRAPAAVGIGSPVPGYASVLVPFDPFLISEDDARAAVAAAVADTSGDAPDEGPLVVVPVRYGGVDGPDLGDVADRTGRSPADVVRLHASVEYRVFCVGFTPGFSYLGILPAELELPRRATPRVRVPAGSVAIAGRQTGIYPSATPGGWHILGRTEVSPWDPERDPPALLPPGARVRFEPA